MSAKACRVCLAVDIKLYCIKQEPLKTAVDIILPLNGDPTSFPQFMCYQCSAILIKCLNFIEKSRLSETILYNIYEMQGEVTQSALRVVNRENLQSSLKVHKCTPYSYIELHHIGNENSLDSVIELENSNNETIDDSQSLILTLEAESTGFDDAASEADLENELLMEAEGQEFLFSYNVDLQLENTKFESVSIPLLPDDDSGAGVSEKDKKRKQKKSKTKKKDKEKIVKPKRKDKTAKDGPSKWKSRKKFKNFDENLKKYFNVVLLTYEEQMAEIEARKLEPGYAKSTYKCDKCHKYYRTSETYCNHMVEHDESRGPLECGVCKKLFRARHTLSRHIVCCHQRHYHCKLCPFAGKNRQALIHVKKHQGETESKCAVCNFVASNPSHLARHMALRHERAAPRCVHCGKQFGTQRGCRLHEARAHCQGKTTTEYCCDVCSLTFYKEADWEKHVQLHDIENRNYCEKCQETFMDVEGLAEHNTAMHRSENFYPVICAHCPEIIHDSREYWTHVVRNHPSEKCNYRSPNRPFLCDTCGKGFKSVTSLRVHGARHLSRRAVPCGVGTCGRMFYDHYQAQTHRRNVHSDKRPYECSQCELTFKIKSNLTRHMVVHTGERAYTCTLCSKTFTQASSRDLHIKSVHYKIPPPPRNRNKKRPNKSHKPKPKQRAPKQNGGTLETFSISLVEPSADNVENPLPVELSEP